jgi:predicted aspartyl protease
VNDRLESTRYPYIPIILQVAGLSHDVRIEAEAYLDTGFEGEVLLPESLYQQLGTPESTTTLLLPSGDVVTAGTFDAEMELPGLRDRFPVTATLLGDEFLVGIRIVENYRVILDHGREVIVEP